MTAAAAAGQVANTSVRVVDITALTRGRRVQVREELRRSRDSATWAGWWHEHQWWARQVAHFAINGDPIPAAFRYGYLVTLRLARLEVSLTLRDAIGAAIGRVSAP